MIPKFRARNERGNWHVGLLTFMFGQYAIVNETDENTVYLIDKETVGQSTGLKDKNGVEIFEGDICIQRGEEPYSDENMTLDDDWEYTGIIKFQDFAYWLQDNEGFSKWLGTDYDEIEVIGNVWDNPELLEGTE
ncbi:hypothetical protein K0I65_000984 [Enterococcus faecalis]|uniref:YopX family protein n=1 Tax=Enterococcus faecalis TaxID=1351 RepID=UPI000CF09E77|nr:YopX family protein [Enterococcus faecalis]EHE8520156.1 hypothetical protein [Enterococcus faecalis]EHS8008455.1 hypothetical protein [Enterococcus faecalis]EHV2899547.1 hypothetical protein [Enterococcus faecalis]EIY8110429.1 hypothetical protein [Enterococcus faecalis]PQB53845.1 hypothetical protein CUN13_04635 [Enterococcus faecalis]